MTETHKSYPMSDSFEAWLRDKTADPFEGITGLHNEGRPDLGEFPKHYRQNGE